MGDNKGQTIFLSVIGIATLLVAIIGATFAYFATSFTDSTTGNVSASTAKIGTAKFVAQGVTADNTSIFPGWSSGAKTITVTIGETDVDMNYSCYLDVTANGIKEMELKTLTTTNTPAETGATGVTLNEAAKGVIAAPAEGKDSNKIKLFDGKVKASAETAAAETEQVVTYVLELPESGLDQTEDNANGKQLTATVYCELAGAKIYYNDSHKTGTTEPTDIPTKG